MKLLEKFESSMSGGLGTVAESSIDILVNINSKGAVLEAAAKAEEEGEGEEGSDEPEAKTKEEGKEKGKCDKEKEEEEDEEGADEEIEESEVELKTLPELIDENMQITLYSLNEEMTEVVEEKVDFIVKEEASEEEETGEPMTDAQVEKEMAKSPRRPLKFLFLSSAKNTKIERLKKLGKTKKILITMAKKATKLDHLSYLEKDRDTTIRVLKTKKETLDSYGLQAKVQKFIDWLEGSYKDLLEARRAELIATKKGQAKKAAKEEGKETVEEAAFESIAENFLAKLYSYDEETDSLTESMAIISEDDIEELQESGKYFTKVMAVVEARLDEKVDSIVANMKSTIARADKYKLEKMQRDLPVTIAKTNVKKQKAVKKGDAEKAKEYDRLLNYLRSGAPNDIKARIRTVQTLKEAAELGLKVEVPVVEAAEENLGFEDALQESETKDAVSIMMQYKALDNDGDTGVTAAEADKKLPNEMAGEENNGTEGFHPESVPTVTTEAKCGEAAGEGEEEECTGEEDCACEACSKERQRKQAIKEARCKK